MKSQDHIRTEANQVLETFAELYLETKGIEDHSVDELESVPDLPIDAYDGWEYDSEQFWDYQTEIADEIDELAG